LILRACDDFIGIAIHGHKALGFLNLLHQIDDSHCFGVSISGRLRNRLRNPKVLNVLAAREIDDAAGSNVARLDVGRLFDGSSGSIRGATWLNPIGHYESAVHRNDQPNGESGMDSPGVSTAEAKGNRPAHLNWDTSGLQSHRCSVATASATGAQIILNFGTKKRRDYPGGEVIVELLRRVTLDPLTAKHLLATLQRLIAEHDARPSGPG
jgi:hypothetical protein